MEVKCDYCGSMISDQLPECPNCGAPNVHMARMAAHTPQTINELKSWYEARNLPPYEVTRYFVGVNYTGPKAYGIYEDQGKFIVYKNKADGSRAVRYSGTDEAYAVNELYLKLKSDILDQKASAANKKKSSFFENNTVGRGVKKHKEPISCSCGCMIALALFFAFGMILVLLDEHPLWLLYGVGLPLAAILVLSWFMRNSQNPTWNRYRSYILPGYMIYAWIMMFAMMMISDTSASVSTSSIPTYYQYDDTVYCYYDDGYYTYDADTDDYSKTYSWDLPDELQSDPDAYRIDDTDGTWDSYYNFESSEYYSDNYSSSYSNSGSSSYSGSGSSSSYDSGESSWSWSSSDDSWDWGSDSDYDWDSGSDWDWDWGSDWDSDW